MKRNRRSCRRLLSTAGIALMFGLLMTGCTPIDKPDKLSTVGLRAYFASKPGAPAADPSSPAYLQSHLQVEGEVYKNGAPLTQGAVALKAESGDFKYDQSIFVPILTGGKFRAPQGSFDAIPPGAQVSITARLTPGGDEDTKTIVLNSESDRWRIAIDWLLPVIALFGYGMFMYAFTGRENPKKNRAAIIFSYVIIIVFLAVPILAPVTMLRMFPKAVYAMIGYPAGLVVTRIGDPPHDSAQWAINIGGYSHICRDRCLDPSDPRFAVENGLKTTPGTATQPAAAPASAGTRASASTPKPGIPGPSGTAGGTGTSTGATAGTGPVSTKSSPAPGTASTSAVVTPPSIQSSATPATTGGPTDSSTPPTIATRDDTPLPPEDTSEELVHPDLLNPPIVKVEGGLVVPLYVIALSIIGGAINMTRKVPGFQREGEDGEPLYRAEKDEPPLASLRAEANAADDEASQKADDAKADGQSAVPPSDRARKIDDELDPLILAQMKRVDNSAFAVPRIRTLVQQMRDIYTQNSEPTLNDFATFDEWYVSRPRLREILGGSWRVELLNQYMYLISAPFLAIVTYYMLDLLGLSKAGVVVVLSFSVGLISEKIVTWILGIATGYMQSPNSSPSANK